VTLTTFFSMALRHRNHASGKTEEGVFRDEEEYVSDHGKRSVDSADKSIDDIRRTSSSGSSSSRGAQDETSAPNARPTSSGTLTAYIGSLSDIVRNLELDDVYRYWSKLRDWLSDVPCLAVAQFGTSLPPSIAGLYYSMKPPSMTPEQQEALDKFVNENVGIPYTHEEHWELLRQLWSLSFPDTEVQPEQHDAQWKRLGFQGNDPATDFRSAGVLSVHALVHFAEVPMSLHFCSIFMQQLVTDQSFFLACHKIVAFGNFTLLMQFAGLARLFCAPDLFDSVRMYAALAWFQLFFGPRVSAEFQVVFLQAF
jgi:hypothetical protein